jgi:hypothetical protein
VYRFQNTSTLQISVSVNSIAILYPSHLCIHSTSINRCVRQSSRFFAYISLNSIDHILSYHPPSPLLCALHVVGEMLLSVCLLFNSATALCFEVTPTTGHQVSQPVVDDRKCYSASGRKKRRQNPLMRCPRCMEMLFL